MAVATPPPPNKKKPSKTPAKPAPAVTDPAAERREHARRIAARVKQAESQMTDDLRALRDEIVAEDSQKTEADILGKIKTGARLLEAKRDASGRFGPTPIELLEAALPISRDSIRPRMVLAERFSESDVRNMMTYEHAQTHDRLTWTHFAILSRLPDAAKTDALARQAVAAGWSSRELNREVIRLSGGPRSAGGRKQKKPGTLSACLDDMAVKTQTWVNAANDTWMVKSGLQDLFEATRKSGVSAAIVEAIDRVTVTIDDLVVRARAVTVQLSEMATRAKAARVAGRGA